MTRHTSVINGIIGLAVLAQAFGSQILGIALPTNVSTVLVITAVLAVIITNRVYVPLGLVVLLALVLFQSFVVNMGQPDGLQRAVHFIGLCIFAVCGFATANANSVDLGRVARGYYRLCQLVAVLSVLQVMLFVWLGETVTLSRLLGGVDPIPMRIEIAGLLPRAIGVASEPQHLALLLSPGAFMAMLVLLNRPQFLAEESKVGAVLVLCAMGLTFSVFSFAALAAIAIAATLSGGRVRRLFLFGMLLACGFGYVLSTQTIWYKLDRLWEAVEDPLLYEYTTTDLSGFALISNVMVAKEVIEQNGIFGTGIDTHYINYDRFLYTIFAERQVIHELNREDAGSLATRLLSEFGIIGVLVLFAVMYLWWARRKVNRDAVVVNRAAALYIGLYTLRLGNYLDITLWVSIAIYIVSCQMAAMPKVAQPSRRPA